MPSADPGCGRVKEPWDHDEIVPRHADGRIDWLAVEGYVLFFAMLVMLAWTVWQAATGFVG